MFDIDDTLIIPSVALGISEDAINYKNVAVFKWFQEQGHQVGVWSKTGEEYAKNWAEKLNLKPYVILKKEKNKEVDVCFDDCDVDLARTNIKIKRINNSISRVDWNKTKHIKL